MNYYFHPAAEAEHLETVAYYESRRAGLGASYLAEFEQVMASICLSPHRYPIEVQSDIRRKKLSRYIQFGELVDTPVQGKFDTFDPLQNNHDSLVLSQVSRGQDNVITAKRQNMVV